MVTVYIPDNFIPERTYAVSILLHHYIGVEIEIIPGHNQEHYVLRWGEKSIIIHDHFFGLIPPGHSYLEVRNIPEKIISTQSPGLDNILLLYGDEKLETTRDTLVCHVDLFAGVFFMLTRWEEAVISDRDQHDRFPASSALLVKSGFILRPVVDEYASLLRHWLSSLGYPVPAETSKFKVVPTCDVDAPYYWRTGPVWKIMARTIKENIHPFHFIDKLIEFKSVRIGNKQDPFDQFDYLMTLAERSGLRFEFNMIGGGKTRHEGYYNIQDPRIRSLMHQMTERGHKIGVHPSYASFRNAALIKNEKEAVALNSGITIDSSRQHYLRFELPATWNCLIDAGIKIDSTLGYAAEPGFRCGTSKPFPVFDFIKREELPLIERPLLIMDVSFKKYKNYSIDESIDYSKKIIDQVKKHNGELVFLWHNSSLSDVDGWTGWSQMLEHLNGSN